MSRSPGASCTVSPVDFYRRLPIYSWPDKLDTPAYILLAYDELPYTADRRPLGDATSGSWHGLLGGLG